MSLQEMLEELKRLYLEEAKIKKQIQDLTDYLNNLIPKQ